MGVGTGFVVRTSGVPILVSNYHVLSGKHPKTQEALGGPALPDRVLIPLLRKDTARLTWTYRIQRVRDDEGNPLWVEHPQLGFRFDVVALPLAPPSEALLLPYEVDPGADVDLVVGSGLAIVGFPKGMSASGITAIWKGGSIASEPDLDVNDEPYFWIDSNTREGMSGSPVIARRFGGSLMKTGDYHVGAGVYDRTVGVYAGRAFDAPDMTLGRVWKWEEVRTVIERAGSLVLRGIAEPVVTRLEHHQWEAPVVTLDMKKSVEISGQDQSGKTISAEITLGSVFIDTVLNDQRFGLNLNRLKMSAQIEAAIQEAEEGDGKLELSDEQYSVLREAITDPSQAYHPGKAKQVLPLLEYVLEAGQGGDAAGESGAP